MTYVLMLLSLFTLLSCSTARQPASDTSGTTVDRAADKPELMNRSR